MSSSYWNFTIEILLLHLARLDFIVAINYSSFALISHNRYHSHRCRFKERYNRNQIYLMDQIRCWLKVAESDLLEWKWTNQVLTKSYVRVTHLFEWTNRVFAKAKKYDFLELINQVQVKTKVAPSATDSRNFTIVGLNLPWHMEIKKSTRKPEWA